MRWIPHPVRVFAQIQALVPERFDPATGMLRGVGNPDSVHALAVLENEAHAIYHVSGVARFGTGSHLQFYGSEGTIKYELAPHDRLWTARRGDGELREVDVPAGEALEWRVEAEFIAARAASNSSTLPPGSAIWNSPRPSPAAPWLAGR